MVEKVSVEKEKNPKVEVKVEKNYKTYYLIAGILLVAIIALFMYKTDVPPTTSQTQNTLPSLNLEQVVAKVNGQEITESDIKRVQSLVLAQSGTQVEDSAALERAINEKLMLEEAQKEQIDIPTEEAEIKLGDLASQKGMTLEELKAKSNEIGTDYNAELEVYRQQLIIGELLKTDLPSTEVTTEEAKGYYEANKENLFPDGVVRPFDEIEKELKDALAQRKFQGELTSYLNDLRAGADIRYLN